MYKKNQICTVTITDLGAEGEGIGKIDGYPLFVKDALPGDVIEARLTKVKKNFAFARLERILKPSEDRVEAACPYARQCGGCQIMPLSYEKQLRFKEQKVYNNLQRIGGLEPELLDACMEPIIGMDPRDTMCLGDTGNPEAKAVPLRYRNKAQFPFGRDKNGQTICGFYAGRTHTIIPNTDCLLGIQENKQVLEAVLSYMEQCHVKPYEESSQRGLIRHVLIRKGHYSGQIMVCLIINGKSLPKPDVLISKLCDIEGMHSISISSNEKNTNVILGETYETIWGEDTIEDTVFRVEEKDGQWERKEDMGVTFRISPLSFYQVNPVQMERLYSTALSYAGLTGREMVWDLYCGIGTISLFLAKKAARVYGVEIVPQAIRDAKENAERNGLDNVEFYVGKAEEVLPEFYSRMDAGSDMLHPDVIVVDPPRKGCDEACLSTMVKMQPQRIVYVSCDSATLARDVKYLRENGYELNRFRACDMFGNTGHVETVILLSRKTPDAIIEIDLEMSELDLTRAESKATYKEIEEYVQNKYGLHVSNLYIAQVKREFGIIERINYNVGEGKNRVPKVTPEKREAIIDALKYFQMI